MEEELRVPRTKVHFTFDPEADWQPVRGEWIWATELGHGHYLVDNIPFFVRGVSLNDTITAATAPSGDLEFVAKVRSAGHSTLRIITEEVFRAMMCDELMALGCGIEGMGPGYPFAVDVPPTADLGVVLDLCKKWLAQEIADYETGCLQSAESSMGAPLQPPGPAPDTN